MPEMYLAKELCAGASWFGFAVARDWNKLTKKLQDIA
jgi:hypothetical protein